MSLVPNDALGIEIQLSSASLRIRRKQLLTEINESFKAGSTTLITGPNGSGKSTMLRLITGERKPSTGTVERFRTSEGLNRVDAMQATGYVPQLLDSTTKLSVHELMTFLAWAKKINNDISVKQIPELLSIFELETYKNQKCTSLSGGFSQRLMIAQSCLGSPGLLVFDEPTSAADAKFGAKAMRIVREYHPQATVIVAAHDSSTYELEFSRQIKISTGRIEES